MSSKFDYRDPGTDARYCDGISDEGLEEYPVCRFCGQPLGTDPTDYYCDALCEQRAIQESEDGK
jgi:hypothetical protein